MANNRSVCPRCNNYVEGHKISSFKGRTARTVTKAVAKEISKDAVELGTMGAGAAIGSLICPGVGTVIGAAAGWVGKAIANDTIGKKVDQAADYLEDEYTEVVYQYSCPKCGHSWTSEDEDYDDDYDEEDDDDYEDYDEEEYDDEEEDFRNEFNYYLENGELIVKDKNEVLKKVQELEEVQKMCSDFVKSEYSFLQSIYCLDFILENEDYSLLSLGEKCIRNANRYLDDGEYILVKLMFESLAINHNAHNVIQLHESIQQRCPKIHLLENTMFKNEHLASLYETCRYFSLYDSCVKLEEKEEYLKVVECLQLILSLSDIGYQLFACEKLMDYYFSGKKEVKKSENISFSFALRGYVVGDFSNDFNPELRYHQRWLRCLSRIAYCYLEGAGTKQDYQKALEYTTKAANLGDKCSIANLGDIYELGRGVSPNKKLALEYYEKALSLGFELVRDKVLELKGITSSMTSSHSNIMTDEEQEYLDEVKICLEEDGEISPKERRLLDRLRTKLGISEMRAKELEGSLNALKLTEEEQEYLEEYKLCLEEDGEISSKERRLLDRLREKLGISISRAIEIEKSYQ